jgi:putative ABC transport system permease protein
VVGFAIEKLDGSNKTFSPPRDTFSLVDGSQGIESKKEQFGRPVLFLFALTMLVLLVACANLAALLLVRSAERSAEAGVRLALGGSRAALMRAFLAESMTLAIAGGVAGWALARLLTDALLRMLGSQGEGLARKVQPDDTLFAFCATITLVAGFLFGLLPAWRATQSDPMNAIRARAGAPSRTIASRLLIAAQIAFSFALLFVSGLFVRTLHNLRAIDVGFRPENVALLRIDLSRTSHAKSPAPFFEELLRRARELPDTRAASLSTVSLLSGGMMAMGIRIPGYTPPNGVMPTSYFTAVSSGYFRTLGIPLIAGRDLTEDDRTRGVAIVNQQFAREFFQGDALGKSFEFFDGRGVRVVGIAANAHFRRLREEPQPVMYFPMSDGVRDTPFATAFLQVRAAGDDAAKLAQLRALVAEIDPRVPIDQVTTMEMQIDEALARERLLAFLSTSTGATAMLLAAIGLYGVMSFAVQQRRREIGIRMAVGATRQNILAQFLTDTVGMVAVGAALGIPLALTCGKAATSLLYGLQAQDASTGLGAASVLGLIALGAALIPAWRAAHVDPTVALRWE